MSDSQAVREQLDQAMSRLESAVERVGPVTVAYASATRELRMLKEERERLGRTLADLQADGTALRTTSDAVADRLDRAIGRLQSMLGSS
jgi:uncharacterized coiled-coil DUF342 family protein